MSRVPDHLWLGRVCQVIDPHYFSMHLGTKENLAQFEEFEGEVQAFARYKWVHLPDVGDLELGQLVLVDTGDTHRTLDGGARWRRGQVANIASGTSVDVFYVDYGNNEVTTVDKICCKLPQPFRTYPPQAVRCSLAGIQPISKTWTSRGIKTFQRVTGGKMFRTLILYGVPGYCEVALYPSDEANGRSVSHMLLDEDVAMPVEDREVPEYKQDVPSFMDKLTRDAGSPPKMAPESPIIQTQLPPSSYLPPSPPSSLNQSYNSPTTNKPVAKYIPPNRKQLDTSAGSPGSNYLGSSPGSGSNHDSLSSYTSNGSNTSSRNGAAQMGKLSPQKGLTLNTNIKPKQPTVDFFPFENVSTYPPSPVSPVKTPGKSPGYPGQSAAGHMFPDHSPRNPPTSEPTAGGYDTYNQYNSKDAARYNNNNTYSHWGYKSNTESDKYPPQGESWSPELLHVYSPKSDLKNSSANAAANLEPSYLSTSPVKKTQHQTTLKNFNSDNIQSNSSFSRSPVKSSSQERDFAGSDKSKAPFYPPKSKEELIALRNLTLTPPDFYKKSPFSPSTSYNQSQLTPPGYYHSNHGTSPVKQPITSYSKSSESNYNTGAYHSPSQSYSHSPDNSYHHYNNHATSPNMKQNYQQYSSYPNQQKSDHKIYNNQPYSSHSYNSNSNSNYSSYGNSRSGTETYTTQTRPEVKVKIPTTPLKSPSYEGQGHVKQSPVSPESPGIAAFNLGDLEHTQNVSADELHQRMYRENLAVLQEEADDIAAESKEQSHLVQIARFGSIQEGDAQEYQYTDNVDIFEQIAAEISSTSNHKEYDELRKSPIKCTRQSSGPDRPPKIEHIPASYIADIDFTQAVKEALEWGKTDGMENAKPLMDGIVESLTNGNVQKQLYDVLLLMLAKCIQEYNLYHRLVLDTIQDLNREMEIKECLSRALKRQQEICIRVPVSSKSPHHLDFSRVMGHVYNMAVDWNDSNSSIQDNILITVEKWIVFNNKGTQTGQVDKENVFLDCFGAFWEIAGDKLLRHNSNFRSRIHMEIRKKLLNENVARCIRERLLDIVMELFSLNVSKVDVGTQTTRRTMIPSSCQVKPCQMDQGTMTMSGSQEDDEFGDLDPDTCDPSQWYAASEFVSTPEPGVSLRPRGRLYSGHKASTPHDHSTTNTSLAQDTSYISNTSVSVYETPNESLRSEHGGCENTNNSHVGRSANGATSPPVLSLSEIVKRANISETHSVDRLRNGERTKSASPLNSNSCSFAVNKGNVSDTTQKLNNASGVGDSVAETKSATGRSIVDWFDYVPEPSETQVKPEIKKSEQKKKSNTTVIENSANEPSVKSVVSVNKTATVSASVSVNASNTSAKNSKKSNNKKGKKSTNSKDKVVEVSPSVKVSESVSDAVIPVVVEETVEDKDWWGADDVPVAPQTAALYGAIIYTDEGPDVIIEEEVDHFGDNGDIEDFDIDEALGEALGDPSVFGNNESVSNSAPTVHVEHVEDSAINKDVPECLYFPEMQDEPLVLEEEQNTECTQNVVLRPDEKRAKPVDDDFGFDSDGDDLDNWESDTSSSDDAPVNPAYNNDFPSSDLSKPILHGVQSQSNLTTGARSDTDNNYAKNFPKSNLAEYIPQLTEVAQAPPPARWVPGKRKCMTCHDEGHTTDNCPNLADGMFLCQ